jgi:Bacterial archaeo-eukaryotic release factor family 3
MKYDVLENKRPNRPSGSGSSQARGSIEWAAYTKEDTLRFCQQIDRGLHGILKDKKAPLVFAGVDYLYPIYREVNSYPHLVERAVTGNPEGLSADELRKQAWAIVEPYFQKKQDEALAQYRQSAGTGLASNNVMEILPAAHHGRVGILFATVGVGLWGSFRPESGEVIRREKAAQGDEDLVDLAVIQTLLNAGTVYTLKKEEMPEAQPLAAVFRY